MIKFEPVIKWSGSKRSQANEILTYFPKTIETYYEPFCGGCSMLYALLKSDVCCGRYVASDINADLINLWNLIKTNPDDICTHYEKLWTELNRDADVERKKSYFADIRSRLNSEHNPMDFMFIMRTTTNGMPRYNSNGDFNNSFHVTRNGIEPHRLAHILYEWSSVLNLNNVEFVCRSYDTILPNEKDFVYLDPPYANTRGMYYGSIEIQNLFSFLRRLRCGWVMSFDGKSGDTDNTYDVPGDFYDLHTYIKSGNSSFKRTIGKDRSAMVYESLYVKYASDSDKDVNEFVQCEISELF